MSGTYPNSHLKRETPQYAYALAILSGGVAIIAPQIGSPISAVLSYALLAALFGSIWPETAVQWACWLCLPMILLLCFDVVATANLLGPLITSGPPLIKSVLFACLGAYTGSILSVHKIASHFAGRRTSGKGLKRGVSGRPVPKGLAPTLESLRVNIPARDSENLKPSGEALIYLQDLSAAVIKAVHQGDPERIRLLIARGADINIEARDAWGPLVSEIPGAEAETVRTLFGDAAAAAPGASRARGWTALMVATVEGQMEVVRVLLGHGARVNAANMSGWTALRFAVSMGETEILRLLLEAGADANLADSGGQTALMQAAAENITDSLKVLLEGGADPYVRDREGQTALMIAQKQGHAEAVKILKAWGDGPAWGESQARAPERDDSRITAGTHRIIKARRDQYYGLLDRYQVIPIGLSLPYGCEETGIEGSEEECWNSAWKSNIGKPAELGWWLRFSE